MVDNIKSILRNKPLWQKVIIIFMWPFTLSYIISKQPWSIGKKAIIIGGMWVFVLGMAYMDEIKTPPAQQQENTQQVEEENLPTDTPVLSFAEQPLTQESVKAEIAKIDGILVYKNEDLKEIKIIENGNDLDKPQEQRNYIVTIIYDPASVTPESLARSTANSMVQASEMLFKHPKVSIVRVTTATKFVDSYGKEFDGDAMRLGFTRATADKIDWKNMKEMVELDYKKILTIADEKYLSPAIAKDLK